MTILGIDPGIARMGFGVIQRLKTKDQRIDVLGYGCIETKANTELCDRLLQISTELEKLVKKWSPDVIALEQTFFNVNVKTAMTVGRASGVVLLLAAQNDIKLVEYNPQQVKVAVTGFGRADKGQVQRMITRLLELDEIPTPDDTADALALALCHAVSTTPSW